MQFNWKILLKLNLLDSCYDIRIKNILYTYKYELILSIIKNTKINYLIMNVNIFQSNIKKLSNLLIEIYKNKNLCRLNILTKVFKDYNEFINKTMLKIILTINCNDNNTVNIYDENLKNIIKQIIRLIQKQQTY